MNPAGDNWHARADWYPDPWRRFELRFHNGTAWTADVSSDGNRYIDPLGSGPAPLGPPGSGVPRIGQSTEAKRDGLATAAMVLGIVALTVSWIPVIFVAGAVCAVLALVFAGIALRRRKPANRAFAITGLATGGAGLLMVAVGVWATSRVLDALDEYENPSPHDVEVTRCSYVDDALAIGGRLTHRGERSEDFRIVLRITGAPLADRRVVISLDDVDADEARLFEAELPLDPLAAPVPDEPFCRIVDVTGPLPFGLDIDR